MAGKIRPGPLGDPDAVEPCRLDQVAPVHPAGRGERTLVEERVRDRRPPGEMPVDDRVDVAEGRLADDMVAADAVDPSVERRELVARVDERLVG